MKRTTPVHSKPMIRRDHKGAALSAEEIAPTEGKTEVWVGGKLVGELEDVKSGDLILVEDQDYVDAQKAAAEQRSKAAAAKATQSKKEVARMR